MNLILPGPKSDLGVRLVKAVAPVVVAECVPDIAGLFLQDDNLAWTLLDKTIMLNSGMYALVPVCLKGTMCDAHITWETSWEPTSSDGTPPIFFGLGPVGVVGFFMSFTGRPLEFSVWAQPGTVTIQATCDGTTYGPVTVNFIGGYY